MKAKDLMINDWVSVSGTPMQVACIGTTKVGFYDEKGGIFFHLLHEEVKPIPLTVEILYRNGFDCDEDGFISYNEFSVNFGRDPFEVGPNLLFVLVGNCHVELRDVNELQHALRLCGIEKEIEI